MLVSVSVVTRAGRETIGNEPEEIIRRLVAARGLGKTLCPSEAARALANGGDWRARMAEVHAAVDRMLSEGAIALSWKDKRLTRRDGPYRIGLPR